MLKFDSIHMLTYIHIYGVNLIKFFVAFIFTFLIILSAALPVSPVCESLQGHNSTIEKMNYADDALLHSEHATSEEDCHDGQCMFNCHLGHCSFVISNSVIVLNPPNTDSSRNSFNAFFVSNYSEALFRPPII